MDARKGRPMTRRPLTDDDERADERHAEEQARMLAACPSCGADTRHEQCRAWCDTSAALYD